MFLSSSAYLLAFSRFMTVFVFGWAGISKLRDFSAFERAVVNFNILPKTLVKYVAVFFISGELAVVALMLLGNRNLYAGFGLAAFLLLTFSVALISVLARKLSTPCNCFGASMKPVSRYDVLRNMGLVACSLIGWLSLPNSLVSLELVEVALLGLMAVTISIVWIKFGDLIELFQ
jgi:uncharacterized membrane protein YphA (DoxX/SURF4 family)